MLILSREITIFSGALGLNTVDDPVRINRSNNGLTDLQVAVNISIDKSRRVNRRVGYSEISTGDFHSLFAGRRGCFVGKGTSLYEVASDFSLTGVRSGLTQAKISYAQSGPVTYYTNGYENGYIEAGVSSPWAIGTYTGPTTDREFVKAPVGNHLAIAGSRMLIAEGNVLWWSEPYNFDLYNQAESYIQFRSNILMISPVDQGVFLSTENRTVFLRGVPGQYILENKFNYPALEWSEAFGVNPAEIGFQEGGQAAVWASPEGAAIGLPSGGVLNLNRDKVLYPEDGRQGFGCLMGFNYIHGVK